LDKSEQIAATIREIVRQEELLFGMPESGDFFDNGVSSLAVIQMQIRIEEELKVTVPTSDLMEHPTISDWIGLYAKSAIASSDAEGLEKTSHGMAQ
jgi:acyl carrier protein